MHKRFACLEVNFLEFYIHAYNSRKESTVTQWLTTA